MKKKNNTAKKNDADKKKKKVSKKDNLQDAVAFWSNLVKKENVEVIL